MAGKEISIQIEAKISGSDKEVVGLLADGYTVSEISDSKKINRRTLEARLDRLKTQLGCSNAANLVSFFLRNKLIE